MVESTILSNQHLEGFLLVNLPN
ncbi:hypothetical protein CRENPOLYSF2_1220004 [Crenothrix polyspora]|uniref:Uncharacterized protein n=1 Tax=Crenothrix polyspora TaxID=360316 RepID=A0A1R4H060_9GAMM|nr:hypothetical protein CRENPOLYSF2_1220004 [Crenothrix polyspora]